MTQLHQWFAAALLAAGLAIGAAPAALAEEPATAEKTTDKPPCHWWQFGHCGEAQPAVDGLPQEAPRQGTIVTVDLTTNTLYLFRDGELVKKSAAATGSDKMLKKGSRIWWFRTPRGRHIVKRKIEDPVWRKPDWAFIEEGERVPAPDSPKRLVKNHLGKYALDLGDGIMIHGTDDPDSIGRKASHGCIRLPEEMLETVWKEVPVGSEVWIFESKPQLAAKEKGLNDLEMVSGSSQ